MLNSPVLTTVTATRINGTIEVPPNAWVGAYNVNITTQYGGSTPGTGLFTVTKTAPALTTITPSSGWRNQTVAFTITGTNFEPETTTVLIRNASGMVVNDTMLTSITPTRITGTVMVPPNAWTGAYNVNISTQYGGSTPGTGRFAVVKYPAMTITSITPGTIYRDTTVAFTVTGTNFEPGLSSVIFTRALNADITTETESNNATMIRGIAWIPDTVQAGTWNVVVSTIDGGNVTKTAAVTVL